MRGFLLGLAHVLNANVLAVLANAVLVFGLPFVLTPEDYGHWQLYQLYALLLGYLTFGLTDGVYVRYAGRSWRELPHARVRGQFWVLLVGLAVATAVPVVLLTVTGRWATPQGTAVGLALLGTVAFVPRTLLTITLQATERMREYALVTVVERVLVLLLSGAVLVAGGRDFAALAAADVAAKVLALLFAVLLVPRLVLLRRGRRRAHLRSETSRNARAGLPVLGANLALLALPAVARLVVESQWSIVLFGALSLGFNVSNMLMVAVTSAAVVLFPRLRRVPRQDAGRLHASLDTLVGTALLAALVAAFPAAALAGLLLPDYAEGLRLLPLLFAVFYFDSSMRLLAANWLKALRRERTLLAVNAVAVGVGSALLVLAGLLGPPTGVLLTLLAAVAARSLWAEHVVRKAVRSTASPAWRAVSGILVVLYTVLAIAQPAWWEAAAVYGAALLLVVLVRRRALRRAARTVAEVLRATGASALSPPAPPGGPAPLSASPLEGTPHDRRRP